MHWLKLAAAAGHTESQYLLGRACVKGAAGEPNSIEAAKWFRKAAEAGHGGAQWELTRQLQAVPGSAYAGEIFKWSLKAAEQGIAEAQHNLGICYAEGCGVEEDETKAVEWFRKATEQGDPQAQCHLAERLRLAITFEHDLDT